MRQATAVIATLVVCWVGTRTYALERGTAPPAITEEERIEQARKKGEYTKFPLGLNVSLVQGIGAATFVADKYVRRPAADLTLSVSPYWRFTDFFRFFVGASATQSIVENYESVVTYQNRLVLSNTVVGLQHLKMFVIPVVNIGVGGELSAALPTSPESRFRNLIVSTKARLSLSRAIGPFYLRWGGGLYKNFNRYETSAIDTSVVGKHVIAAHFEGNEQLTTDVIAAGPANVSFGVITGFMASWNITQKLALAVYYELNKSWTYQSFDKDDLSSEYAIAGRGERDATRGVIDLSYQITPELSVSVGTSTAVLPKTADNKAFIFPFMNLSNNYRNNTQFYIGLNGAF